MFLDEPGDDQPMINKTNNEKVTNLYLYSVSIRRSKLDLQYFVES